MKCTAKITAVFLLAVCATAAGTYYYVKGNASSLIKDSASGNIDKQIQEFIEKNPEVLIKSLTNYQNNQVKKQAEGAEKYINSNWDKIAKNPNDPFAGNPDGDITIVEFFDYSCGYCKHALPVIQEILKKDPKIKFVFKEFPILSENSDLASRAALAVYETDKTKYFAFHQNLLTKSPSGIKGILAAVSEIGLDPAVIEKKINESKNNKDSLIQKTLTDTRNLAGAAGIGGTPAFIVQGQLYPGALDLPKLEELVKNARDKNNK